MPFISINVTGLDQIINDNRNKIQNSSQWNINALNEGADLFVNVAKEKVHKITTRTQRSIRKVSVTRNVATIQADWGAKFEEQRSGNKGSLGPHKFGTETIKATIGPIGDIIRKHYKL